MLDESMIVRISWQGPFRWPSGLDDTDEAAHALSSPGLYQVYGHHVVFGPSSLLYVGMTDTKLRTRLKRHREWLRHEGDVTIRLGLLDSTADIALLRRIESLTIWWHSPPYNSQNIWRHNQQALWIQNLGARGSLQPEYTTAWVDIAKRPDTEEER